MSRFYGTVQGNRGEASRIGHAFLNTWCASWEGAVHCHAWAPDEKSKPNGVTVRFARWQGHGKTDTVLYDGPIDPSNKGGREAVLAMVTGPALELLGVSEEGRARIKKAVERELLVEEL